MFLHPHRHLATFHRAQPSPREEEKYRWLLSLPQVESNIACLPRQWLESVDDVGKRLLFSFFAFHPTHLVKLLSTDEAHYPQFCRFIEHLKEIEKFYAPIGGVIGYQKEALNLLSPIHEKEGKALWKHPPGEEISKERFDLIYKGLEALPQIAHIYPVGGAGDRLNLRDEATGEPMPVAKLPFLGHSLLEGLFRDLQAQEYLYEQLFGKSYITPVALMTSKEKRNVARIRELLEENNWFGRPSESIEIIQQPPAPLVTNEGAWVLSYEWKLYTKPGGHGAIWKCIKDSELFPWFESRGCTHALIRQINNPICSLDHALLSFMGLGMAEGKTFGFLSCPRKVNASEGTDVLYEREVDGKWECGITNIEYTDFEKKGIEDKPMEGSPYSKFPSNTNILFLDLEELEAAAERHPFPGLVFNPKTEVKVAISASETLELKVGRIEAAMQNIADALYDTLDAPLTGDQWKKLSTYIAYNDRKKTISVTKRAWKMGEPMDETPLGSFYDYQSNMYDLFTTQCAFDLPKMESKEHYDPDHPPFIITYHPALGPLWSIIGQKVRNGSLAEGSEMQLEIAQLKMEGCHIEGSLLIDGGLQGHCTLEDVQVKNRGIDFESDNRFWKNRITRHEALKVTIEGSGELIIKGVTLTGDLDIKVPDGEQLIITQGDEELLFTRKCAEKKPLWSYTYKDQIELE